MPTSPGVQMFSSSEISLTVTFHRTPAGPSAITFNEFPRRGQRLTGEELRFINHLLGQIIADAARQLVGVHVYPQEGL